MRVFGVENATLRLTRMPRANRHFLPGFVWHLTHRCHKREFLLSMANSHFRLQLGVETNLDNVFPNNIG